MTQPRSDDASLGPFAVLALIGFIAVATANASNIVFSRANAGQIPPFSLAFFRWTIVGLGLALFAISEIRQKWRSVATRPLTIMATGFCGMFVCGGPIYEAGVTTTAINMGLIMAVTPIVVLLISWFFALESIKSRQLLSVVVALPGVVLILSNGSLATLTSVSFAKGDLILVGAMLAWSVYNVLQLRALADLSFISRTCLYALAGAALSLPLCVREALNPAHSVFSDRALVAYLFVGIVPGIIAYAGLAFLAGKFGAVRASLTTYVTPIATVVLSIFLLGEAPTVWHLIGGVLILAGICLSIGSWPGG